MGYFHNETSKKLLLYALSLICVSCTEATQMNELDDPIVIDDPMMAGTEIGGMEIAGTNTAGTNTAGTNTAGTNTAGTNTAGTNTAGTSTAGTNTAGTDNLGGSDLSCDIMAVLDNNTCTTCHGVEAQGSLNLVSEDFEQRLINAPSHSVGCQGRLLIDSERPERSLILQAIGAVPQPEESTCQVVMPSTGSEVSTEDQACFTEWVRYLAAQANPDMDDDNDIRPTVATALRKIKVLIHGGELTQEEIAHAEQNGLRSVVEQWTATEAFDLKMIQFFEIALQQLFQNNDGNQFGRLRNHQSHRGKLEKNLQEMIPRTALHLAKNGQDFTSIATTRTWMVTTASLVALLYPDQMPNERNQTHFASGDVSEIPNALRNQISQKRWYIEGLEGTCNLRQLEILNMLQGFVNDNRCDQLSRAYRFPETVLTEADYNDWRLVELTFDRGATAEEVIPFYDVIRLRSAETLVTRLPRVGFYTSPAFFNQWPTNVDNEFRVTVNQALIGGLHMSFQSSDVTDPIQMDALDEDHAEPNTECYGCHRQLDPMRVYFARDYNADYRPPSDGDGQEALFEQTPRASFAFVSQTNDGGRVGRLGTNMASHFLWSHAWIQKICLFANSARCVEDDPVFIELKNRFKDQNHQFIPMLLDVLTSPLVTGLEETEFHTNPPIVSITRRNHLCSLLAQRTGADVCNTNRVRRVLDLIPNDSYSRGAIDFTQPTLASPFFFAAAQSVCEEVAIRTVNGSNEFFNSSDEQSTLNHMVTRLMSIPSEDERYPFVLQTLQNHYQELRDHETSRQNALRSTFIIACLSPDVMGVGL